MAGFESSKNDCDATLCANNCGFYGNPNNRNLCSVCYVAFLKETDERRESSKSQMNLETIQSYGASESSKTCENDLARRESSKSQINLETIQSSGALESPKTCENDQVPRESSKSQINLESTQSCGASESPETCGSDPAPPKTKNRCEICRKKVGILGFSCRCGGSFCGKHRYPEEHSCGFNYKEVGRKILAKQIVECRADKLEFRI